MMQGIRICNPLKCKQYWRIEYYRAADFRRSAANKSGGLRITVNLPHEKPEKSPHQTSPRGGSGQLEVRHSQFSQSS